MRDECNHDQGEVDVWAESLVVLAVVGVKNGRTRDRLYRSLRDIDPARIDAATRRLEAAGVVQLRGRRVTQSTALERLDRLDMISI
ncbi:MAG: hypothetical protein JWM60_1696 [Solirubrobacterales bacterium]|nr:hypothetical protein [Solirubrobacterales bacterium]